MPEFRKVIDDRIKDAGTRRRVQQQAEDFIANGLGDSSNMAIVKTNQRFLPGKIYIFDYEEPITEAKMPWWDAAPVVLSLGQDSGTDIGLNLNLFPSTEREIIIEKIFNTFQGKIESATRGNYNENALRQLPLAQCEYNRIINMMRRYGIGYGVRRYLPNLKANQGVIAYEKWVDITLVEGGNIQGAGIGQVHAGFRKYIKSKNLI
tara:strand:+ start:11097 stop:11714 length:618 start_codon:yes stop_codon:yes gene_type:complete